jgi:hypothetical protein
MDLTLQRRLLYGAAGGCLLIAAATVVWSLGSLPDRQSVPRPRVAAADNNAATETNSDAAERDRAGVDLELPLQQTLYDPPPPPKPKPKPKPAVVRRPTPPPPVRLDWTLLGTIIEPQRRAAILSDATGKTDIRAVGEQVDLKPAGVLVHQVDSEAVTLELRGTRSTLRLKQDFSPGDGQPPRGGRRRNR